jgi:hypothetical protein
MGSRILVALLEALRQLTYPQNAYKLQQPVDISLARGADA